MPMYEYRCHGCGKVFEIIQRFSDEPLKTHEECGGPVERLISAPALQFKGSGWYITDYARGGNSPAKGKDGGNQAKSESTGDSKTQSKSESSGTGSTASSSTSKTE